MEQKFRYQMHEEMTLEKAFEGFIDSRVAMGVAQKTIWSYTHHIRAFKKHIDFTLPAEQLSEHHVVMCIRAWEESGISRNTISGYVRHFRAFLKWARKKGYTTLEIPTYKGEEVVQDTYSDEELKKLLKKPNLKKCLFTEYRTWVIINLLVDTGIRAGSLREIRIGDIDLPGSCIRMRHTKNKKTLVVPISPNMQTILVEYLKIRQGDDDAYLFPSVTDGLMSHDALRHAISRYNQSRGVEKTGVHMFRHTFARLYLVECGGDALKLQRLLGHSTLEMTRHYVKIFDRDLIEDFQRNSPLQTLAEPERIVLRKRIKK